MNVKLGMRIPPKIGSEGILMTAQWAVSIGLDVLDVSNLTPEVKESCNQAGNGIGSEQQVELLVNEGFEFCIASGRMYSEIKIIMQQ
jgi:hypothetical protein